MKKRLIGLFLALVMCAMPMAVFATYTVPDGEITINADVNTGVGNILGLIKWIGFVVAIIMILYVGVKYLGAGAGQKAEVKSTMVPMLAGAALIGLGPTIVQWIWEMFNA